MKLTLALAVVMAIFSIGKVFGYKLDKMTMRIMENGKVVDEKIYVDTKDNYEIFSVPAHDDRSALLLVNDFKRGYSIYKVADESICYIVPLDVNTKKPSQLKKSVKQVQNKFPSSKFTVEHKTFLKKGAFDLSTSMGMMAEKFCGNFEVVNAEEVNGDVDLMKIAQEEQHRLAAAPKGSRVRRDAIFEDFHMACDVTQVTNSLSTCPADYSNLKVVCKFRVPTCVYSVNCDFGIVNHVPRATCVGDHRLSSAICCDYNCP